MSWLGYFLEAEIAVMFSLRVVRTRNTVGGWASPIVIRPTAHHSVALVAEDLVVSVYNKWSKVNTTTFIEKYRARNYLWKIKSNRLLK